MADVKILKGIRFPPVLIKWIGNMSIKSGRTFSAEVIHQLTLIMEKKMKW